MEAIISLVTLCCGCLCFSATATTMNPSHQVEKEAGNTTVVVPFLTVAAAVAVLAGLVVFRRYVNKRFAAQPESQQPGLSSALIPPFFTHLLRTDVHPRFPTSTDPPDYESVDFQPSESEWLPSFTDFRCGHFFEYVFFVFLSLRKWRPRRKWYIFSLPTGKWFRVFCLNFYLYIFTSVLKWPVQKHPEWDILCCITLIIIIVVTIIIIK